MNATAQRVKALLIEALSESFSDYDLSVVDAKAAAAIELPLIAVDVVSTEPHSAALPQVYNLGVEITLRLHAGDENHDAESWKDAIESLCNDASAIMDAITDQNVRPFQWLYASAVEDWNENIVETKFSAAAIVGRI